MNLLCAHRDAATLTATTRPSFTRQRPDMDDAVLAAPPASTAAAAGLSGEHVLNPILSLCLAHSHSLTLSHSHSPRLPSPRPCVCVSQWTRRNKTEKEPSAGQVTAVDADELRGPAPDRRTTLSETAGISHGRRKGDWEQRKRELMRTGQRHRGTRTLLRQDTHAGR